MKREKKNIFVNLNTQKIELTKEFAKKAGIINSEEYKLLNETRAAYPTYQLSFRKSSPKKSSTIKGINVEFMVNYIENHNDACFLEEFNKLKNGGESFFSLKAKFVEHYPTFKNCKTKADWILAA